MSTQIRKRKVRPDSDVMANYTPEQQAKILEWFKNHTYPELIKRIQQEFGRKISEKSLRTFFDQSAFNREFSVFATSANKANQVVEHFRKNPTDVYAAILQMVGQIAFELSLHSKEVSAKELAELTRIALNVREYELRERKLDLERERFEFEAARALLAQMPRLRQVAQSNALDDDEKLQRVREMLFGKNIPQLPQLCGEGGKTA
ncbi:MAG: hypothetical protein AB1705_26755 [Verrucomicrobiota bacterium]